MIRASWHVLKRIRVGTNEQLHTMVRGSDGGPEAGQSRGLRDILGFSGDREMAVIVRMGAALSSCHRPLNNGQCDFELGVGS